MKKLFLIAYKKEDQKRRDAFLRVCNDLGVELVDVNIDNYYDLKITSKDLFYRITNGVNAQNIEKLLIMQNKPKTLYKDDYPFIPIWTFDSNIIHQSLGIPIVKTTYVNTTNKEYLKKVVKRLNGFPIIIKVINKSKGLGIQKADNENELVNKLKKIIEDGEKFILREYIDSPGISYRSIILGDKVLVSYKNESVDKTDFRSNINQDERLRKVVDVEEKNREIFVKAVKDLNVYFGAIDYVFDKNGEARVLEVNFPCNFIPAQELSKVDIAKEIINFMIKK